MSPATPPETRHRINLSGVDLARVNLTDANLSGMNLSGTDLRLAAIRAANFHGANLQDARWSVQNTVPAGWRLVRWPRTLTGSVMRL